MNKKRNPQSLHLIGILSALSIFTGCQSYNQQNADVAAAWNSGDLITASTEVTKKADEANARDKILWKLEQGAILQIANDPLASNEAFDVAEVMIDQYEEEAKVKLASETGAIFSNQATLPYRGQHFDKIMMNTFKALNYLQLAQFDLARIELNRAYQRQENAVIENKKELEKAQLAAEKAKDGVADEGGTTAKYDLNRAESDPKVQTGTASILSEVDDRLLPYAPYVNPFSEFLGGVYFSHLGFDNADIERARKAFERVKGMSPGTYIEKDFQMAESMANGSPAEVVTYVIFATGAAPSREEFRVDIPLFLVSKDVSYVGASFPKLKYHDNYIPGISARLVTGEVYRSELLADMDAVVSTEFKNGWRAMFTKTMISAGVKATLGYLAEESVKDKDWKVRLAMKVASVATQAATNRADVRTWTTLPKQFSYIRLSTPADGLVNLETGNWSQQVTVNPGTSNIIMVRSVNNVSTPVVVQAPLAQSNLIQ